MEYSHVRVLEIEIDILLSEIQVSALRIIRCVRQNKNFADEMEFLEIMEYLLEKYIDNPLTTCLRDRLRKEDPNKWSKPLAEAMVDNGRLKQALESTINTKVHTKDVKDKGNLPDLNLALDEYLKNVLPNYVDKCVEFLKKSRSVMDYNHVRELEIELSILVSNVEFSALRLLRRVCILKNVKDKGSVEIGHEMEFLESEEKSLLTILDALENTDLKKDIRDENKFGKELWEIVVHLGTERERLRNTESEHEVLEKALQNYENKIPEYEQKTEEFMKMCCSATETNVLGRENRRDRDVVKITSQIDVLAEKFLEKICELKNFKDGLSVEEIKLLDMIGNMFCQSKEIAKIWMKVKGDLESYKNFFEDINTRMTEFKAQMQYNVPKRQTEAEPLNQYVVRLKDFMKLNWKKAPEGNRGKRQAKLSEMMQNRWIRKRAMSFRNLLVEFGTQISMFLVQYFMVSSDGKEISETLFEVETILRCLSVGNGSTVINNFVSIVQLFDRTIRPAAISDDRKAKGKETEEEINFLLRMIMVEILRLEVACFYPNLQSEMFLNEEAYMRCCVKFEEKPERIRSKINELRMEISIPDEVLDEIKAIWNNLDL
ncbi:hypothetical protein PanWU01x14_349710 [Parasponia andersonii]|uniref:Uncharacterized protein n=1 Tax=Parasponia andersonii TaxID=3476 RepID=A0A2P5AB78_PARAD|nr:hypothetical protein PanWU01x14_349710 [Parasponia andersonii]